MAFPTGWTRRCALTIQHAQVPSLLLGFPVLVTAATLPTEMITFAGANAAQADGGDIRFTSDLAGATQIACEIEEWFQDVDPTQSRVSIWVGGIDLSPSVDVTIYVWYNAGGGLSQPAASAAFGSQAVWDSGYLGVWHVPLSSLLGESTSHGRTLTDHNSVSSITGQIDGAAGMASASSQYLLTPGIANPSAITLSGWLKLTSYATAYMGFFCTLGSAADYVRTYIKNSGKLAFYIDTVGNFDGSGSHVIGLGAWTYVVFTYSSAAGFKGYVNGAADATAAAGGNIPGLSGQWSIGAETAFPPRYIDGGMDEMRMSNLARSADWITAEYNNQSIPTNFIAVGTPASTSTFQAAWAQGCNRVIGSGYVS